MEVKETPFSQQLLSVQKEIEKGNTEAVDEFAPDEIKQVWAQNSPLGRLLEMDEVARLIVFLCSEANTAVNGEVVEICGGRTDWF